MIFSLGEGAFSCCGINLPPLSAEKPDENHKAEISRPEGDVFVRFDHPMTKEHYISFAAYANYNGVIIKKLYPEQEAEVRFPFQGKGKIFFCCSKEGLFKAVF